MILATLLGAAWVAGQQQIYNQPLVNFSFTFPQKWMYRAEQYSQFIEIPLPNGGQAVAELSVVQVRSSATQWQATQAELAHSKAEEVERQWQDQVIDFPLLLTRISSGEEKYLVGLIYSDRLDKMTFRLTMPADQALVAETAWLEAFKSLEPYATYDQSEAVPPRAILDADWNEPGQPDGIRKLVPHAGAKAAVEMPPNWTLKEENGFLRLETEGLKGTIILSLHEGTIHDSRNALRDEVAATLGVFENVRLRNDLPERRTKNLVWLNAVERQGRSQVGEIVRIHASGYLGGHYWMLEYRAPSVSSGRADKDRLTELFDYLVIAKPAEALPHADVGW